MPTEVGEARDHDGADVVVELPYGAPISIVVAEAGVGWTIRAAGEGGGSIGFARDGGYQVTLTPPP